MSKYDCLKCPGYCCSYPLIEVTDSDVKRLADHFGISPEEALDRFTKYVASEKVRTLRHQKDDLFKTICMFFDTDKRQCTVYEGRPKVCRKYPNGDTCGYWEFLHWERKHQADKQAIALTS